MGFFHPRNILLGGIDSDLDYRNNLSVLSFQSPLSRLSKREKREKEERERKEKEGNGNPGEKNKKTFPQAEPPVSFSARAYPFLQLLKAANKKKKDIYWG